MYHRKSVQKISLFFYLKNAYISSQSQNMVVKRQFPAFFCGCELTICHQFIPTAAGRERINYFFGEIYEKSPYGFFADTII